MGEAIFWYVDVSESIFFMEGGRAGMSTKNLDAPKEAAYSSSLSFRSVFDIDGSSSAFSIDDLGGGIRFRLT